MAEIKVQSLNVAAVFRIEYKTVLQERKIKKGSQWELLMIRWIAFRRGTAIPWGLRRQADRRSFRAGESGVE